MTDPVLAVHGLTKSFGALTACDGVSLDLRPGEIHALIGPNGAGKSTLIKQVAGEIAPDAGTIHFLGRDVTDLDAAARARMGLGRSFQISAVSPEVTVLQNVILAQLGAEGRVFRFLRAALSDRRALGRARDQLERVRLAHRLADRASEISHGERRRLELAMALALRPRAFLLDEPMAGMGAEGVVDMTALLDSLRFEAPILLIEHDMDAVFALADRISVLVYGALIATGGVQEIKRNRAVQRAYLGEEEVA
jgi:branched-chain amino acid transport system ATP-binding protein